MKTLATLQDELAYTNYKIEHAEDRKKHNDLTDTYNAIALEIIERTLYVIARHACGM